ncbi:MAG: DUF1488 domain-containing protein [Gammaproteobacteria bacterium]|nr:DUF1488 domain-containing protein [Gammaproteobacteria bacterium]MBL6998805.1 DUF1488 domain-containing protein [Gammaproteobacteria bacterium]
MSIHFPNSMRSFDESKNRVCFWGYDKTIEVSFYMGVDALQRIEKGADSTEAAILIVFDAAIDRIHQAAAKLYNSGNRGKSRTSCILIADDF